MISNQALTPLIISEQTGTSSLGIPLYYPVNLNNNTHPALEHTVYIGNELKLNIRLNIVLKVLQKDMSINLTHITCAKVDDQGLVNSTLKVNLQEDIQKQVFPAKEGLYFTMFFFNKS
jgi:hypothetical protein